MYHFDDLDIRIIREIGSPDSVHRNVRVSYAAIARKLRIDEETIRLRVKRAREAGAFPTWRLMLNPRLLGCTSASLEIDVAPEENKPRALSQLRLVDGVTSIVDYRGRGLQVTLYTDGGEALARQLKLIESICSAPRSVTWTSRFPSPDLRMRSLDWKIIRALNEDAGQDLAQLAKSLKVSARTVQRRLAAMREADAIFLSGAPKLEVVGGLNCCFVVHCPEGPGKRSMDSVIRAEFARVGHVDTSPVDYSHIGVPCENLAEADRLLERLRGMESVRSVRMHIMNELIPVQKWLTHEIDRRVSTFEAGTSASRHGRAESSP